MATMSNSARWMNTPAYASCLLAVMLAMCKSVFSADAPFTCVLTCDKTAYVVGDNPVLTVRIVNTSSAETCLVGLLDGSDAGWRFPMCKLEVIDSEGNRVIERKTRCGNMNLLRATDFVSIPAGAEFNPCAEGFFSPYEFHHFPVSKPGSYTVRFFYSTNAKSAHEYGGHLVWKKEPAFALDIQRLLERVPRVELKSNELKLTFSGQPKKVSQKASSPNGGPTITRRRQLLPAPVVPGPPDR